MYKHIISLCLLLLPLQIFAQNITFAEYYIDEDKGLGQNIPVEINNPGEDIAIEFNASLDGLSEGIHLIGVRTRDANGVWSLPTFQSFIVTKVETSLPNIIAAEYFIDEDKGFGQNTVIDVNGAATMDTISFNVNLEGISPGIHLLHVRAKDANNHWSLVTQRAIVVDPNLELANIVALKYYYYDVEASQLAGDAEYTYTLPTPATMVDTDFPATVAPLTNGKRYALYIWAVNESGNRSLVNTQAFTYREEVPIFIDSIASQNIACAGDSNGSITVTASGGQGELLYSISTGADTTEYQSANNFENLGPGQYTIYVRGNGSTDYVETDSMTITAPAEPVMLTLDGMTNPDCDNPAGGSFSVAASGGSGGTYTFSMNGDSSTVSSTFENLTAGVYTVVAQDSNGCSATLEVTLESDGAIPPKPNITLETDADSTYYATEAVLTVTNAAGAIQWHLNGEPIEGATENQLTLSEAGEYTVVVTSASGCSSESEPFIATGMKDAVANATRLFPNPVEDYLTVSLPTMIGTHTVQATLYNMLGAEVAHYLIGKQENRLNMQQVKPGAYVLILKSEDFIIRKRITKKP